jgi:hypothetical protein
LRRHRASVLKHSRLFPIHRHNSTYHSSIVLAEITYLYERKRIATPASEIRTRLIAANNVIVYPLDEQVVDKLPTALDIDDGIIVATALLYRDVLRQEVAVVTKDEMIAGSGLINVIW